MKLKKSLKIFYLIIAIFIAFGCVQGGNATRQYVKDYSITNNSSQIGCGTSKYIKFTKDFTSYSCNTTCDNGSHIATTNELNSFTTSASTTVLSYYKKSKGLCVTDSAADRPNGEVYISSDYCSCINGKADIINKCESFCASKKSNANPILYGSVTLGANILNNTKMGNLQNWCKVQLDSDNGTPDCVLRVYDGSETKDLAINVKSDNTFTADITDLSLDTSYTAKIIEAKAGSNASSNEFQIRRITQTTSTNSGAIKISPISQYTCLQYGAIIDTTTGAVSRTSVAKSYYYFPSGENPAAIPSVGNGNPSLIVCHDEFTYGQVDNSLYPRHELIPSAFTLWSKTDSRFNKTNDKLNIATILETKIKNEYGLTSDLKNLFTLLYFPNRPNVIINGSTTTTTTTTAKPSLGYIMAPFIDETTNLAFCPTNDNYNSSDPLFRVLHEFLPDTQGLYVSESEPEMIEVSQNNYKPIYTTMFVPESILINYGFYVSNGIKIKASSTSLHNNMISFYWPIDSSDPLTPGARKLYTVRYTDNLNGETPNGNDSNKFSDKRIGCVPK